MSAWYRLVLSVCVFTVLTWASDGELWADQERLPHLLENEHVLSLEFETPHTKWAQPYAKGKTRVLFFAPWAQGSTEGRETIELLQRFDIEADVAYYLRGAGRLLGDGNPRPYVEIDAGTQRILRLMKQPYDVYFFNQVGFDALPEVVQKEIQRQVAAGAGVVFVGDATVFPFENAKKIEVEGQVGDAANCFSLGKGRGVLLPRREKLEFAVGWEVTFDYQMAGQGRALLWAADRAADGELRVEVSAAEIPRKVFPQHGITVGWEPTLGEVEVTVEIRREDGRIFPLGSPQTSSAREARYSLPRLRAGTYHVVAIARSARGIENWAIKPFEVTSEVRVARVSLNSDWGEAGDVVAGAVELDGDATAEATILAQLLDQEGRVLARKKLVAEQPGDVSFEFPLHAWMPMLLSVEAVLVEGEEEVSSAYSFFHVTKRGQGRFNFVVWNWPSGDLAPYGLKSFAKHGVTAVLQGGDPPLGLAASNLPLVPYASSFRKSSHTVTAMLDENGVMKGGCIHDPQVMREWVDSTVTRQQAAREHGVLVYSLGDENAVRGSCLSGHCLHAYQKYLKEIYGDVAELNAEWATDYPSFDAVELLEGKALPAEDAPKWFQEYFAQRLQKNRTDREGGDERQIADGDKNDEMLALQDENYARWYDRQAFQCNNYVLWCKEFAKAFRQLDPKSLTGFEGTDSFSLRRLTTRSRQGGDLDAFVRELEYFGPYHGPGNEVVRSIADPTFPMGNWIGYSMDREMLLERYWGQITNCMNTVQWWRWDNLDGYHGFLAPTFAPFPGGKELLEDTQVVRDGLGTLLMNCQMHDDDVAMLYSMPSTHIAHFDGNRSYGNSTRDHTLWHQALHDSGVQFRYVTDRMLRLGEFEAKRYKVLILPLSFAIGPVEAEVIREFVRDGGTLIADVRPGIYDGHCKPLEVGSLDEVFGIRRTGKQEAVELDRLAIQGAIGEQAVEMRWGNWFGKNIFPQMKADPTVTVTTGKALGQAYPIHYWSGLKHPLCIVNEFGKGRAVLLNFPVYDAPFQPLVEGILASAGVTAKISVSSSGETRIPGLEVTRWKNQEIEIVALLGDYEGEVLVKLPSARQVYDLKTHASFGKVDAFKTRVRPHRASFFAMLPETAPVPQVSFGKSGVVLGETVQMTVRIPGAVGKHALQISATTPEGNAAHWLKQNVIFAGKPLVVELPFAHNDPRGKWTVTVADLFTAERVAHTIVVETD